MRTGTDADGSSAGNTCTDWTATDERGNTGRTSRTNDDWTSDFVVDCDTERRLYCFQVR